jgi:hypothetical protein
MSKPYQTRISDSKLNFGKLRDTIGEKYFEIPHIEVAFQKAEESLSRKLTPESAHEFNMDWINLMMELMLEINRFGDLSTTTFVKEHIIAFVNLIHTEHENKKN